MPPLLPALPAIIGAAGSIGGALLGGKQSKEQKQIEQQQVLTEQDQRRLMDQYAQIQQQYGKQAADFYLQYMAQGNPFLRNLLSQHFQQIGKQYQDQRGQLAQRLEAQGFGVAPSGLSAATMGDLSRAEAGTQSESWLNDMLQNEQIKFQAAQGLGGIANMFQPGQFALHRFSNPQVPPSPWTQVPGAIGTGLGGLLGNKGGGTFGSVGGVPDPALGTISAIPGIGSLGGGNVPFPNPTGVPGGGGDSLPFPNLPWTVPNLPNYSPPGSNMGQPG